MEQFEQLHRAAAAVNSSARPLPLYYAYSQALMAIAAVHTPGSKKWRSASHGMSWRTSTPLFDSKGYTTRGGSFDALCRMQHCAQGKSKTITFRQVWQALPDLRDFPFERMGFETGDEPVAREVKSHFPRPTMIATGRVGPQALPDPNGDFDQHLINLGGEATPERLARLQETYSSLPDGGVILSTTAGFEGEAVVGWPRTEEYQYVLGGMPIQKGPDVGTAHPTMNGRWLIPRMIDGRPSPSGAAVWWLLLFALSNYSRYEPARWAEAIDVDGSPTAVAVETAMERAIDRLPELVYSVIRDVAEMQHPTWIRQTVRADARR